MTTTDPAARFTEFDPDGRMAIHDAADIDELHDADACFVERPGEWRVLFDSRLDAENWIEWWHRHADHDAPDPDEAPLFRKVESLYDCP